MEADCRFSPSLQQYLIALKVEEHELSRHINPTDFAARVERMLAEKVAQALFEKIEPQIINLLKDI